jgi:hypothetical protein
LSRGTSGRIVIEVEPGLKNRLYAVLSLEGRTLKDWFVEKAQEQLQAPGQLRLFDTTRANSETDNAR